MIKIIQGVDVLFGGLNMFEMVPGSEAESKIHRPTDLEWIEL